VDLHHLLLAGRPAHSVSSHVLSPAPPRSAVLNTRQLL
jgi:hypothetical protein